MAANRNIDVYNMCVSIVCVCFRKYLYKKLYHPPLLIWSHAKKKLGSKFILFLLFFCAGKTFFFLLCAIYIN